MAAGAATSAIAAGLTSTLLAGTLGSSSFGIYALVVTTASVLAMIAGLGLGPILIREIARHPREPHSRDSNQAIYRTVMTIVATSAVVAVLIASPLGQWSVGLMVETDRTMVNLMAILVLAMSTNVILAEAFRGMRRFGLASFGGPTLWRLLTVAVLVALVPATAVALSASMAVAITASAAVVAASVSMWALVLVTRPSWSELTHVRPAPALIPRGLPIAAVGVLAFVLGRLPIWVLGVEFGPAEIGVYAFALSVSALVGMVTLVVNGTFSPFASSLLEARDLSNLERRARQAANVGGLAAAAATVPAIALEALVVSHFLGPEFSEATITTAILLCAVLARTMSGPSGLILVLSENQRWTMVASACGLFAGALLILPASRMGGVVGAAGAVACAQVVEQALLVVFVKRRVGVRTFINLRPAAQ